VSVSFFARDGDTPLVPEQPLPEGVTLHIWRPEGEPALIPWRFDPLRLAAQWQARLGLFEDARYAELSLWRASTRVHRLVVTPRWHRFPFMAPGDLQVGALWTHPAWRRSGLARLAIDRAHRLFPAPGRRFWYVADSANAASLELAATCGYRFVGEGIRTKPLGFSVLGRFELDRAYALA
jgi:GNAT superfamily N-acetyltransferase